MAAWKTTGVDGGAEFMADETRLTRLDNVTGRVAFSPQCVA